MTDLERIQLRRELEKTEKLMELNERTRSEVFRLACEIAHDSTAAAVTHEYKRIARVVRMAMRRGANLEADRQWKVAVTV